MPGYSGPSTSLSYPEMPAPVLISLIQLSLLPSARARAEPLLSPPRPSLAAVRPFPSARASPTVFRTSTAPPRAFPGGNRRPYRRPPWERRPSSATSRRSASPVLLHPNRPWEWIPGELLHLPHPFPWPFFPTVRRSRRRPPWRAQSLAFCLGLPGNSRYKSGISGLGVLETLDERPEIPDIVSGELG